MEVQRQSFQGYCWPRCPEGICDRFWRRRPNRIRQANLIAPKSEQALGNVDYSSNVDGAGIGAAERDRDIAPNPDTALPSGHDDWLESLERAIDRRADSPPTWRR
jgi:hypothetical protein